IGTSSPRRKAQLIYYRQDLKIVDLRGNLDTRIKKLNSVDAIVVAAAGCIRTNLHSKITQFLSTDIILPAAGQGSLGIEIRKNDTEIKEIVSNLNDEESSLAVIAERSFLKELGGGCQIPIGVLGCIEGDILKLESVIVSPNNQKINRAKIEGKKEDAVKLGKKLAKL
ncbi:MAG: hydroxymethylbilane synthase, partial [bacterium]